ncbi:MAG: tripartite tricarboxylate transporter substrate binding protein, partial [Burkholderiales bacterium]
MRWVVNVAALYAALFSPLAGAQTSSGQAYPSKVIRIINPFAPGGSTDIVTRAITERLIPVLKQQVIVEHRPGAMTNLASEVVAKSP